MKNALLKCEPLRMSHNLEFCILYSITKFLETLKNLISSKHISFEMHLEKSYKTNENK